MSGRYGAAAARIAHAREHPSTVVPRVNRFTPFSPAFSRAPCETIHHVGKRTALGFAMGSYAAMPKTGMRKRKLPMLTSAMLRRLLIAVATLSMSMFFAAEGFAMANTHAVAHSKPWPTPSRPRPCQADGFTADIADCVRQRTALGESFSFDVAMPPRQAPKEFACPLPL